MGADMTKDKKFIWNDLLRCRQQYDPEAAARLDEVRDSPEYRQILKDFAAGHPNPEYRARAAAGVD